MISDTDRRAVARRLRGIKDTREGCEHDMCCDLWSAIFDSGYRCTGLCDECEVAVLDSLADLIEPSCDRDAERTCRDTDCDTESITCSECGEITRYTLFWVDVDGGKTVKGHRPRFCSNCGRRVLYDSDDYI